MRREILSGLMLGLILGCIVMIEQNAIFLKRYFVFPANIICRRCPFPGVGKIFTRLQYPSVWKASLDSLEKETAANEASAFKRTQQWWQQFWARSFIIINNNDTSSSEWQTGRNFQLFRYMLACNAKGEWPTKFNGGLFTVDPVYTDTAAKLTPDFRNWGGGLHTAQNQRLVYFPMIKNGDWDALQAQFNFYLRILKNAELRTKVSAPEPGYSISFPSSSNILAPLFFARY